MIITKRKKKIDDECVSLNIIFSRTLTKQFNQTKIIRKRIMKSDLLF